jgi:hypothetical protein
MGSQPVWASALWDVTVSADLPVNNNNNNSLLPFVFKGECP